MIAGVNPYLQLFLAAVLGNLLHEALPLLTAIEQKTPTIPEKYHRWQWYVARTVVAIGSGLFALQVQNDISALVIGLAGPAFFDTYIQRTVPEGRDELLTQTLRRLDDVNQRLDAIRTTTSANVRHAGGPVPTAPAAEPLESVAAQDTPAASTSSE